MYFFLFRSPPMTYDEKSAAQGAKKGRFCMSMGRLATQSRKHPAVRLAWKLANRHKFSATFSSRWDLPMFLLPHGARPPEGASPCD